MSPTTIAKYLNEQNICLAALTDHNTALNTPAFAINCRKFNIAALYGMEAQTAEEIHVLTLFTTVEMALDFCAAWYKTLPDIPNKPDITGDQVYVDEKEDILGEVEKYLITSSRVSLDELVEKTHEYGGLVIPAHVDRPSFSMSSQFGTVIDGKWDAVEFVKPEAAKTMLPSPYPVITSSDAHYAEHIGRRAFELDIGNEPLKNVDGTVNLKAVRAGFEKLVIRPEGK